MTEKRVKAWAVVGKNDDPIYACGQYLIAPSENAAKDMAADGERVVPVTIIVEEK